MASVHAEATPLAAHEAHTSVCQPQKWRQPGEEGWEKINFPHPVIPQSAVVEFECKNNENKTLLVLFNLH